ncbi:hypothetical protein [Aeromonas enteropelogenes]|uniref:hypothetical protein n=1 Tax=Aeromonas enteropelogenes TaxID=29489 RepID=UPI003BA20AF4
MTFKAIIHLLFTILTLLPLSANANRVVMEGKFRHLTCAAVMFNPTNDKFQTHDFEKNYFDNMKFSITKDSSGYKMTTDLYSGQFVDVNSSSDKLVFVQSYNDGTEIATIVINGKVVTYTNTSGTFFNRLCVGTVVSGFNIN